MLETPLLSSQPLTQTFCQFAISTWDNLRISYETGLPWPEETITNTLLLALVARHPQEAIAIPFTKRQEATLGADWEWWLTDGRLWLGLLVQAKALDAETQRYKKLNYKPNGQPLRQLEILVRKARDRALYPLVICYNYVRNSWVITWNCRTYERNEQLYGCSVISAVVADAQAKVIGSTRPRGRTSLEVQNLAPYSYPLHCLVGCTGLARGLNSVSPGLPTLPERALGVANQLHQAAGTHDELRPRVREAPPDYVGELLQVPPQSRRPIIKRVAAELASNGTRGILILREPRPAT